MPSMQLGIKTKDSASILNITDEICNLFQFKIRGYSSSGKPQETRGVSFKQVQRVKGFEVQSYCELNIKNLLKKELDVENAFLKDFSERFGAMKAFNNISSDKIYKNNHSPTIRFYMPLKFTATVSIAKLRKYTDSDIAEINFEIEQHAY